MVVTTATVFATVQDDHHVCLIFPKVSSKTNQGSLFTNHTCSNTKHYVNYVYFSDDFDDVIHFKKETL